MMNKTIKYLFLIFLIIFIPNPIKAEEIYTCDYKKRARHNSIASNIMFNLDYIEKNNSVEFFITITNLHPEIKIIDTINNKTYQYNSLDSTPKEVKISGYKNGTIVKFDLYSKELICQNNLLFSKYITIPPYNKYYKDPICDDFKEYSLCKKWVKNNLTYEDFKIQVLKYKTKVEEEKKKQEELNKKNNVIIDFLKNNYIYILSTVIVVGVVSILFIKKKNKDFRF